MNPIYTEFKRKFSVSMYKNLRIKLSRMSFYKDFVNDTRGDLYPVKAKSEDCDECVRNNLYTVTKGSAKRLFCQFFPFASYEVSYRSNKGEVGFYFQLPNTDLTISVRGDLIYYRCGIRCETIALPISSDSEITLIVSCRPGAFDIYLKINGKPEYLHTFYEDSFKESNDDSLFSDGYVSLVAADGVLIKEVCSYIDNGISIADIRPIKYENGEIISEYGKIHFTASIRMQEGAFQGVFSWIPGTAELDFTGALFYDCGDGKWRNYVAPVIIYHREKKQWFNRINLFILGMGLARI